LALVLVSLVGSCDAGQDKPVEAADAACEGAASGADCGSKGEMVTHQFPDHALGKFEEISPCMAWTLDNDKALYVRGVTFFNQGAFHHSNWFVVPEKMFKGKDGYFKCADRQFDEGVAAMLGTVLYAQSTQSYLETQRLPAGVVIKIPPRHQVIGSAHLLNLSAGERVTTARMSLELVHPRDVKTIVSPLRLNYADLQIPANKQSRHTGECALNKPYESWLGRPLDMKIYYVLPHYHGLGNYFRLEVMGGPNDGKALMELSGFNAEANGALFDPPIDLTGADGLRMTCGYNNTTDKKVGWGIGDQEMCVFLALVESGAMMDGNVKKHNPTETIQDGITQYTSACDTFAAPKNPKQNMPGQEEIEAELYKPETKSSDKGLKPAETCKDTDPTATAQQPATLQSIRETVFVPSCSYSACHGGAVAHAGLDLTVANLREALVGKASKGRPEMDLVTPGKPEQSWLYQVLSRCKPKGKKGAVAHMPLNAPELLDDALVAKVRQWIADGAKD
jgi:hypothetical protein